MLVRATMALMPQPSIRSAAKIIAAREVGNEVAPESLPREVAADCKPCPPHMIMLLYGPNGRHTNEGTWVNTNRGAKAATIEGRAEYLRQLDRQAGAD